MSWKIKIEKDSNVGLESDKWVSGFNESDEPILVDSIEDALGNDFVTLNENLKKVFDNSSLTPTYE